jgi:hypothetical protein
MENKTTYKNLAPLLCRQKVTIEANLDRLVGEDELKDYLLKLSKVVDMQLLEPPTAHPAIKNDQLVGYGGWAHWVTSGCAIYSYDKEFTKSGFYLIDIECYTCKPFSLKKAVEFTKNYFKPIEISYREN